MTSAKAMFQTMKESGIAPTTSSYAALAGAYAQQNNMAAVYEVSLHVKYKVGLH